MADILLFSQTAGYFHSISDILQQLNFQVINAETHPTVPHLYASYGTKEPHLLFSCEFSDNLNIKTWETSVFCFLNAFKTYLSTGHFIGKISFLIFRKTEIFQQKKHHQLLQQILSPYLSKPDFCLISEPVAQDKDLTEINIGGLGNIIINLTATQPSENQHSYPSLFSSPTHNLLALLYKLKNNLLDNGTETFSPSVLNIISLTAHTKKLFETPDTAKAKIHIRYNTSITPEKISSRMQNDINFTNGCFSFTTQHLSQPYISASSKALDILKKAIEPENTEKVQTKTDCNSELSSFIYRLSPFAELNISLNNIQITAFQKKLQELYGRFLSDFMEDKKIFNQQTSNF